MEEDIEMLSTEEISALFGKGTINKAEPVEEEQEEINENKKQENQKTTDEGDTQESGGSNQGNGNTFVQNDNAKGSPNFYSSITKALVEDGVFPDLDKSEIEAIKDASSFKRLFEKQSDNRLNATQKRINEVLSYGVQPTEIQKFENTLNYLFSIKDEALTAENKDGENLRKQLIYSDLINRGYSQEKAKKEVEKSLNAGTDIDDAKEALEANKQYFHNQYTTLQERAKAQQQEYINNQKKNLEELKKSIDDKEVAFNNLKLDTVTKNKIYQNLTEKKFTNPDGQKLTALEKYDYEHHNDFLRYIGAFFTLTDGFTDFNKIFNSVAQNAVKKGLSNLEDVLKGNISNRDGSLKLMGDNSGEEYLGGKWKLDLD